MFVVHIYVLLLLFYFSLFPILFLKSISISPGNHQAVDSVHDFCGVGILFVCFLLVCSITPDPGAQRPIPNHCRLLSMSLSDLLIY